MKKFVSYNCLAFLLLIPQAFIKSKHSEILSAITLKFDPCFDFLQNQDSNFELSTNLRNLHMQML